MVRGLDISVRELDQSMELCRIRFVLNVAGITGKLSLIPFEQI